MSWRRFLKIGIAIAFAGTLVAGCRITGTDQLYICESVIPAFELDDPQIVIGESSVEHDTVTIDYATGGPSLRWTRKRITCSFAGGGFEIGTQTLTGVTFDGLPLSEVQLWSLNRFWLGELGAVAEGRERIVEGASKQGLPQPLGYLAQQLVNGSVVSAIYMLLALAYALVYGITQRINFAFGEFVTLGAYGAVIGISVAVAIAPLSLGLALVFGLALAEIFGASWGAAVARAIYQPLRARRSYAFLVATVGLAIALQEGLRLAHGARDYWLQPIFNDQITLAGGDFPVVMTAAQGLTIGLALFVVGYLIAALNFTRHGRHWKAVADDPKMAALSGVDPAQVIGSAFITASILAAIVGMVIAVGYGGTNFAMGTILGLKALVAAVIGGIGAPFGAALGGVLLGLAETLWSAYLPIAWRDVAVLGAFVLLLSLRPNGLFGWRPPLP